MLNALIDEKVPIIITSGIPNYAFYKIIEKLIATNNKIYYNGDFDPEGLLIALLLKQKFPKLILFGYEKKDFQEAKSQNCATSRSLKKLNAITIEELQIIKNLILKEQILGYQEKNINNIRKYIRKEIQNFVKV